MTMREVSPDEFYRVIGIGDIVSRVAQGKYPYTSIFETRYGQREVGRIVPTSGAGEYPVVEKYLLVDA